MEKPFVIHFNFPLEGSEKKLSIEATAELHHSDPYYVVHSFKVSGSSREFSLLPELEIKKVMEKGEEVWVHKDSGRPTQLSEAIGKSIDQISDT